MRFYLFLILILLIPIAAAQFEVEVDDCNTLCFEGDGCTETKCNGLGCLLCDPYTCAISCQGDNRGTGETCTDNSQCASDYCSGAKRAISYQRACCPEGEEWNYLDRECKSEDEHIIIEDDSESSDSSDSQTSDSEDSDSGTTTGDIYTMTNEEYMESNGQCCRQNQCDRCGEGILNFCDYQECFSLGDCFFGETLFIGTCFDADYCNEELCSQTLAKETESVCHTCGQGWINVCDDIECNNLGDCLFTEYVADWGTCTICLLPHYEPNIWNSPSVKGSNNCYNYATNMRTDTIAQPGYANDAFPTKHDCNSYITAAEEDGLKFIGQMDNSECSGCTHKVALALSDFDYHWYREDKDGGWSHKRGRTVATNIVNALQPLNLSRVTDPKTAATDLGYEEFCGYFCVDKEKINIR